MCGKGTSRQRPIHVHSMRSLGKFKLRGSRNETAPYSNRSSRSSSLPMRTLRDALRAGDCPMGAADDVACFLARKHISTPTHPANDDSRARTEAALFAWPFEESERCADAQSVREGPRPRFCCRRDACRVCSPSAAVLRPRGCEHWRRGAERVGIVRGRGAGELSRLLSRRHRHLLRPPALRRDRQCRAGRGGRRRERAGERAPRGRRPSPRASRRCTA